MVDSRKTTDVVISILLILVAAWIWHIADNFPTGTVVDPMGPAFWPKLLAYGIGFFSLALLIVTLVRRPRSAVAEPAKRVDAADESVEEEEFSPFRFFGVMVLLALYLVMLQTLGYFLGTPLLVLGVLLILGVRNPRRILLSVFGIPLLWGVVFGYALNVPLPEGVFTIIAR